MMLCFRTCSATCQAPSSDPWSPCRPAQVPDLRQLTTDRTDEARISRIRKRRRGRLVLTSDSRSRLIRGIRTIRADQCTSAFGCTFATDLRPQTSSPLFPFVRSIQLHVARKERGREGAGTFSAQSACGAKPVWGDGGPSPVGPAGSLSLGNRGTGKPVRLVAGFSHSPPPPYADAVPIAPESRGRRWSSERMGRKLLEVKDFRLWRLPDTYRNFGRGQDPRL
jgi:hypothetical protein